MLTSKHGGQRAIRVLHCSALSNKRCYASRVDIPLKSAPFPTIDACPSPTCQCRESPPNLEIDRKQNLNGLMGAYAEQLLVCTGRDDWKSRIEDDEDAVLVRQLRSLLGKGGRYSNPFHNVLVTNSSFPSSESPSSDEDSRSSPGPKSAPKLDDKEAKHPKETPEPKIGSAFLVPSFFYVPKIPLDPTGVDAFVRAFLLPRQLNPYHSSLGREQQSVLLQQPELQNQFVDFRKVEEILVLICGHGDRDQRCGKLGPILRDEFEEKLQRQNITLLTDTSAADDNKVNPTVEGYIPPARVGLISHIGGHKFAGNVIIYVPPSFTNNPLAGKGIWYGRVGPEHVEGIVAKTVLEGKVIKEMFRGGISQSGEILRL